MEAHPSSEVSDAVDASLKSSPNACQTHKQASTSREEPPKNVDNEKVVEEKDDDEKDLETTSRAVFVPTRNARAAARIERCDYLSFKISQPKLKDGEQDEAHPENKDVCFQISGLKHHADGTVWLRLSDVLLALGYSGLHQSRCERAFMDSLNTFLCENQFPHPTEDFVQKVCSRTYMSSVGFTLLVPIVADYDENNSIVQHVKRNRFEYLKLFYNIELVTEPGPFEDEEILSNVCRTCCLEDLPCHFERFCDCRLPTHLRCQQRNPDDMEFPQDDGDEYFCGSCVAYLPMEELRARRGAANFEVETVLGFNNMQSHGEPNDKFPNGAYYVKWKNFPDEVNGYIALDASFAEIVADFWEEELKRDPTLRIDSIARRHCKAITLSSGKAKKASKKKLPEVTHANFIVRQPYMDDDRREYQIEELREEVARPYRELLENIRRGNELLMEQAKESILAMLKISREHCPQSIERMRELGFGEFLDALEAEEAAKAVNVDVKRS